MAVVRPPIPIFFWNYPNSLIVAKPNRHTCEAFSPSLLHQWSFVIRQVALGDGQGRQQVFVYHQTDVIVG